VPTRTYTAAYCTLRVFGPDLDPSEVTKALELPPDHTHRGGDLHLQRSRRGRVVRYADYATGMWSMSSEAHVEGARLGSHVEWLLAEIEPKAEQWRALLAEGVEADLFCYSVGSTPDPPSLPKALRDRLETLGIVLDIDHYESGGTQFGERQ